jgi:hypothetical protein
MRLQGPVDGTELIVVVVVVVVVVEGGGTRGGVGEELHHKQSIEKFQNYKTLIIQVIKLYFS